MAAQTAETAAGTETGTGAAGDGLPLPPVDDTVTAMMDSGPMAGGRDASAWFLVIVALMVVVGLAGLLARRYGSGNGGG